MQSTLPILFMFFSTLWISTSILSFCSFYHALLWGWQRLSVSWSATSVQTGISQQLLDGLACELVQISLVLTAWILLTFVILLLFIKWNVSTTIGWMDKRFGSDTHLPLKMKCKKLWWFFNFPPSSDLIPMCPILLFMTNFPINHS